MAKKRFVQIIFSQRRPAAALRIHFQPIESVVFFARTPRNTVPCGRRPRLAREAASPPGFGRQRENPCPAIPHTTSPAATGRAFPTPAPYAAPRSRTPAPQQDPSTATGPQHRNRTPAPQQDPSRQPEALRDARPTRGARRRSRPGRAPRPSCRGRWPSCRGGKP